MNECAPSLSDEKLLANGDVIAQEPTYHIMHVWQHCIIEKEPCALTAPVHSQARIDLLRLTPTLCSPSLLSQLGSHFADTIITNLL